MSTLGYDYSVVEKISMMIRKRILPFSSGNETSARAHEAIATRVVEETSVRRDNKIISQLTTQHQPKLQSLKKAILYQCQNTDRVGAKVWG